MALHCGFLGDQLEVQDPRVSDYVFVLFTIIYEMETGEKCKSKNVLHRVVPKRDRTLSGR